MIFSDSTVAARNFRNTESVLMSSFWTSSLGGKPPVVFQRSTWASRFRLIQLSSSLAIFFLAGSMWLGIAHAQASRQAMDLNFARGPIGNEATLIFPATLDCLGSLNFPYSVVSAMVMAASPAMKIALASSRASWRGGRGGRFLCFLFLPPKTSPAGPASGWAIAVSQPCRPSSSLRRWWIGSMRSPPLAQMDQKKVNQPWGYFMPPANPHLTLPSFWRRWQVFTRLSQVRGNSLSLRRSVR